MQQLFEYSSYPKTDLIVLGYNIDDLLHYDMLEIFPHDPSAVMY